MKIAVRRTPSTSQKSTGEPSWSLIRLVAPTGTTKKMPIARIRDSATVTPQTKPPIGSGSSPSVGSICALAEIARARKPIRSDSASATTPRITGQRSARLRLAHETSGSEVTSISSSGLRTATAQVETPRIITPSSTAWPPTGASRLATGIPSGIRASARRGCPSSAGTASTDGGLWTRSVTVYSFGSAKASLSFPAPLAAPPGGLALAPRRATLEALNPATCVEKLLLARVERMARRADLDVQLRLRGARVELVPARAANVGEHVLGVDPGLHHH